MDTDTSPTCWKKCSACKKEIDYRAPYFVCSVSSCQGDRTGLAFCSVVCWDSHLGFARHRDAYAEERRAPRADQGLSPVSSGTEHVPQRRIIRPAVESPAVPVASGQGIATDTLVVVSKVKQLIRDQSEYNTSQCAIDALTQKVVRECLKGIERARAAGRKTVMGRDFFES